ncbi:hypothetical protein M433DRAFT_158746 [Acidomyces richmondensis BFW]|nr:hypothetical protein M433DRAFT_158746 [Acidomyces richmondensis BFW]
MLCYSRLVNRLKALSRKWNRVAKTAGIRFRLGPRFKVSRQTCLRWTAASCTFRQSHLLTLPSSARLSGNVRHSAAANTDTFANKDHHARIARRAMPAAEMVDFSFSDDRELQQLSAQVAADPESFEHWDKLVQAAEAQEGGLTRNSSPQAIAATRNVYDLFLARFPLFFGYWKKYADFEFTIAGTEAAEMVYERGVASIGISVDLWANYCSFKTETSHVSDVIRDLFERGAECVGLDFQAHPFWDKYLEFEERMDDHDRIFQLLSRIIRIPLHQYSRYFERYRNLAASRSIFELAPPDVITKWKEEIHGQIGAKYKSDADFETEMRKRLDTYHMDMFHHVQAETSKRWTYEQEVKRPYYHVPDLDDAQLANWRKYLDFEEAEGDYTRIKFLYERCVVTAANYDEFWFRYARWMQAQGDKVMEVRNIYQRASCLYVPITRPAIRLQYARFEESVGNAAIAIDIHEAILSILPNHLETIAHLAETHRRQHGVETAISFLEKYINGHENITAYTRGALVTRLARLVWQINGQPAEARKIYQKYYTEFPDCRPFWVNWFFFETKQTPSPQQQERVKYVYDLIRQKTTLSTATLKEVTNYFSIFMEEFGDGADMKELEKIDVEVNGPASVQKWLAGREISDPNHESSADTRTALDNGLISAEIFPSFFGEASRQSFAQY